MKVILGSKTLAGWFEGETEADWEISCNSSSIMLLAWPSFMA